jgi:hypothetical protein
VVYSRLTSIELIKGLEITGIEFLKQVSKEKFFLLAKLPIEQSSEL